MRLIRVGVALVLMWGAVAAPARAFDALVLDPDENRVVGEPDVAVADDGSMVVAWSSTVWEGAQPLNGVRVRRFDADGSASGRVFRIDVLPGDLARKPSVDITPDGSRAVVAWEGGSEGKRNKRRIWVQVFDAGTLPIGEEIRVDQIRMTHEQWGLPREYYRDPKVSIATNGEFVVVWRSEGRTSCDRFNISARRFAPNGEPLGDEFIVNTDRKWSQLNPDVDHDASGGFVVVWQSGRFIGTEDEVSRIRGRIFARNGEPVGEPLLLGTGGRSSNAALPAVTVAPGGGFACAWKVGSGEQPLSRIEACRFDRSGNAVDPRIVIEPRSPGRGGPEIEFLERGTLLVAWQGETEDRFRSPAVVSQIFDTNGVAVSEISPLSPATCWTVSSPSVAGAARGDGAVVWVGGLNDGIIARRFSGTAPRVDVPLTGGGHSFAEMVSARRQVLVEASSESGARRAAAKFLFCMGPAATTTEEVLRQCVGNRGGRYADSVRKECVFALASVSESTEDVIPTLLERLSDAKESSLVRGAAACAVGLFGEEGRSAVPGLLAALEDDDPLVVGCAGRSLGRIGAHRAVAAMAAALLRRESESDPLEMHERLISGLVELSTDERARWALERYWQSCIWLDAYVEDTGDQEQLGDLERYVRHRLEKQKVDDPRMVDWTVGEALQRLEDGWVDYTGYGRHLKYREDFDDIDIDLTRYAAMRNLGGTTLCDGGMALARAIAELDRPTEWAADLFRWILGAEQTWCCRSDLLAVVEGMGARGAPVAEAVALQLGSVEAPNIDAIRALAATDPGCESCVPELIRVLEADDLEAKIEVIKALTAAGPSAIRQAEVELTRMLRHTSPELRSHAEQALDLMEADAEVCDGDWRPPVVEEPTQSDPAPRSGDGVGGYGWGRQKRGG